MTVDQLPQWPGYEHINWSAAFSFNHRDGRLIRMSELAIIISLLFRRFYMVNLPGAHLPPVIPDSDKIKLDRDMSKTLMTAMAP